MAISFVKEVGSNSGSSTQTSVSITVPSGGVALGHHVVVVTAARQVVSTITDSKSNAYQVDRTRARNNQKASVCSARIATALDPGDTITITFAGSTTRWAVLAVEFAGLASSLWFDQSAAGDGNGTAVDFGTTAGLSTAAELIVAAVSFESGAGTFSKDASFDAELTEVASGGTTPSHLGSQYDIVNSTAAVNPTGTIGAIVDWAAVTATYKASGFTPAVGQAAEEDTAQAVTWNPKRRVVSEVEEQDSADHVRWAIIRTVAQAAEQDAAQAVTVQKTIGPAREADAASVVRNVPVVQQASEQDFARGLNKFVPYSTAEDQEEATPVTVRRTYTLGQAEEQDEAGAGSIVRLPRWDWDGNSTLTFTIPGATVGDWYELRADDGLSTPVMMQAPSSTFQITITIPFGLGPGDPFYAVATHGDAGGVDFLADDNIMAGAFEYGNPAGVGYAYPAAWSYDGSQTIQVTFDSTPNLTYTLSALGTGAFESVQQVGDGGTITLTLVLSAPPSKMFLAVLSDTGGHSGSADRSARVFAAVAASGGSGSPPVIPTPIIVGGSGGLSGPRFYQPPPWRTLVTDLATQTVTFLDHLASERTYTFTLNAPAVGTGSVPAYDPEVNIPYVDDDLPFLNEGTRMLFGFRRENGLWVCRFSGIILQTEDVAGSDEPRTAYTAYDPWEYLKHRPVVDADALLPGADGLDFVGMRGSEILVKILTDSEAAHGPLFIDYGQTGFGSGVVESTAELVPFNVQQGSSIADALDQLVRTGTMDVLLKPIYAPVNRPGLISDLYVRSLAGSPRYNAVFGWDKPGRNVVSVSRLEDGAQRANKVQFYVGQGGPAVTLQQDAASIALYRQWWYEQFWVRQDKQAAVEAMALAELQLRVNGKQTYTFDAASQWAPVPFLDYYLGDTVPVYSSRRLRKEVATMQRVYGIPILLSDDQFETVGQLLLSPTGVE